MGGGGSGGGASKIVLLEITHILFLSDCRHISSDPSRTFIIKIFWGFTQKMDDFRLQVPFRITWIFIDN